jgi:hypothetical protein
VLEHDPGLTADRPGLVVIGDKGYVSAELDAFLAARGVRLLRPSYRNRSPRPGEHLLKPIRQLIESVNDTLKGQLDLELHGGLLGDGIRLYDAPGGDPVHLRRDGDDPTLAVNLRYRPIPTTNGPG